MGWFNLSIVAMKVALGLATCDIGLALACVSNGTGFGFEIISGLYHSLRLGLWSGTTLVHSLSHDKNIKCLHDIDLWDVNVALPTVCVAKYVLTIWYSMLYSNM